MALVNPALEARLMVRPKATYAALTAGTAGEILQLMRRPARLALVIGCFI